MYGRVSVQERSRGGGQGGVRWHVSQPEMDSVGVLQHVDLKERSRLWLVWPDLDGTT
jgi:hypothetical protein